jgi:hypothetical protein
MSLEGITRGDWNLRRGLHSGLPVGGRPRTTESSIMARTRSSQHRSFSWIISLSDERTEPEPLAKGGSLRCEDSKAPTVSYPTNPAARGAKQCVCRDWVTVICDRVCLKTEPPGAQLASHLPPPVPRRAGPMLIKVKVCIQSQPSPSHRRLSHPCPPQTLTGKEASAHHRPSSSPPVFSTSLSKKLPLTSPDRA